MDNDVAVAIMSGLAWLGVMIMFYTRVLRLLAKIPARKVTQANEGNLKLVVWKDSTNRSETVTVNTTIPLTNSDAVIRAVRMWCIVRRKRVIEIAEQGGENRVLFRTY